MRVSRTVWFARVATATVLMGSAVVAAAGPAGASTFTVTNANAAGAGSLNDAIAKADAHPGADTITFAAATNHHALPAASIETDVTIKGNGAGVTVITGGININSGGTQKVTAAISGLSVGDFNINSGFGSSTTATITNVNVTKDGFNINSGFDNSQTIVTLTNVKVTGGGSGINVNAGQSTTKVTIVNSSVSGASSEPLSINDSGSTVTVTGSTFSNNHDGVDVISDATLHMTNSTITGGTEQGVRSRGHVTLQNVTITKNVGGAVVAFSGSMSVANSILANNAPGGETTAECTIEDVAFVSHGGNLAEDSSCDPIATDHPKTQPKLGALAANGGPTQTFLPLAGSAAIDGGVAAGCPGADQRGIARPQDGNGDGTARCDVGAVEVAAKVTPSTPSIPPVTAATSPPTVAPVPVLPRTGGSSGPLAVLGFAVLLAGIALIVSPRARRRGAAS